MTNYPVLKRKALFFFILFYIHTAHSQKDRPHKNFFRLYADNDALILSENATDWGYTSGSRIDFFYTASKSRSDFFSPLNQFAGPNRITTKGWGLMQMIIAPQKTSLVVPDKNDYPYAGALFAVHTVHFTNVVKKINLQSEWIIGMMGPPSFAKQTQSFFHHLIGDPPPMGWSYQLPADLLLNYNIKAEKLLTGDKSIGLVGSGELFFGSMTDGLSLHILLQVGKKNRNNFTGLTSQFFTAKKTSFSFSLKATTDLILYNALLQGGLFNSKSPVRKSNSIYGTDLQRKKITGSLDLFILFSTQKFAVSLTQKMISSEFKKYGSHCIGNISIYKTL